MIEKMKKIYVYGLREQSADILEDIMRCGVIQPVKTEEMLELDTAQKLERNEGVDLSGEEELCERLELCIEALKEFGEKRGLFYQRPDVTYGELVNDETLLEAIGSCEKIEKVVKKRQGYEKDLQKTELKKAALIPWEALNIQVSDLKTANTRTICYVLPAPRQVEEIQEAADEKDIIVWLSNISEDDESRYVTALCHGDREKSVREMFSLFGAKEFVPRDMDGTFADNISLCDKEIERLKSKIEEENEKLRAASGKREELEKAWDAIKVRIDCLSGKENLLHTGKVDVLTGWIVAEKKDKVSRVLDKYTCCYECVEPDEDEDFPVSMKNSKIVAPFGALTEMYSLPGSRSMDSNWAIGLFFFIFFGMMLSDAGYGLLLTIGGLGGAKLIDMNEGGKRFMTMIGISGISTMFWGLVYGSFFGDVIPTVADVFFGRHVEIPQLIDPLNQPMVVLVMACAMGVIHIFIGMGFKAYLMIKRGDKWGALFDVGFWYILLIGLPCLILPGGLKWIGIVMSIAGALGLILTQGRAKPTIFGKITGGIMSLYDVTGYFSDVLAYSRILALGLATGVIASVGNTIGTLTGGGIIGAILFIVIFVGGHALNMAINALGAYVHSARLQYVEFFGKYYESGGKKFQPLKAKTKYVKVMEEE
ncbi:MAG: hypothetical protein GX663_06215 [Clostridiales bacterium]|nr:hypothetical protein [Clostridiales bacterium]